MKFVLCILPFLGGLALAQAAGDCQATPLLCSKLHPVTCECQNAMTLNQYKTCGGVMPRSKDCSATPANRQTGGDCQAEPLLCSKLHPVTCECRNAMALNQYKTCGGAIPRSKDCSAPKPRQAEETCECDLGFCAMSWPESCYCKNAAATACFQKCGGDEPKLTVCPPLTTPSIATAAQPQETGTAQICGGGRGSTLPQCAEGFVCAKDPNKPGCGPDCDGTGICVPSN